MGWFYCFFFDEGVVWDVFLLDFCCVDVVIDVFFGVGFDCDVKGMVV